jgi:hypothetical protein
VAKGVIERTTHKNVQLLCESPVSPALVNSKNVAQSKDGKVQWLPVKSDENPSQVISFDVALRESGI